MTIRKKIELAKIEDSKDPKKDQVEFGFSIENGRYAFTYTRGKKTETIEGSNFVMKSLFNLDNGTNDSKRIIQIQRYSGENHIVEVNSSEMKPESFETILKSKRCTFLANYPEMKKIFAKMMDDEKEAFLISEIGWNKEHQVYVFADAIFSENTILEIDELGIITVKNHKYYLPTFGFANLNNEEFKTDQLYRFIPGTTTFKDWSKLYFQVFGANGLIGILFLISTVFRDIIFDALGAFPFLFLFGDFGTGKTKFAEYLLSIFGKNIKGVDLTNATMISLSRTTQSKNNVLFYFKEYTSDIESNIETFFLAAYDGVGRTTGVKSNDNRTKNESVNSSLVCDGNSLPSGKAAVFSRMILLIFEKQNFSQEEENLLFQLEKLSTDGLGNVLVEILACRKIFAENFKKVFVETTERIRKRSEVLPSRLINSIAMIYSTYFCLSSNITFPFDNNDVTTHIYKVADYQNELLKQISAVSIFWTAIDFQIKRGLIQEFKPELKNKGAQYRLKVMTESEYILQIKLESVYTLYTRYCKEGNIRFLDQNSLKMLLTSTANPTFIPSNQKHRGVYHFDKYFGSCHQFMLKKEGGIYKLGEIELSI